jgi:hypothetical protein
LRGEQRDEFGPDVSPEVRSPPMLREGGVLLVAFHESELVWVVEALVGLELQAVRR